MKEMTAINTVDFFCKESYLANQTSYIKSHDRLLTKND